jgi:hypothetical protein
MGFEHTGFAHTLFGSHIPSIVKSLKGINDSLTEIAVQLKESNNQNALILKHQQVEIDELKKQMHS